MPLVQLAPIIEDYKNKQIKFLEEKEFERQKKLEESKTNQLQKRIDG